MSYAMLHNRLLEADWLSIKMAKTLRGFPHVLFSHRRILVFNMENISDAYNLNGTFWSSKNEFPSKVEGIAWCSAFTLEAVITVLGNLLTIIVFAVNKSLRKKCLLLAINMAFADLFFGAVFLPLYIYFLGGYYQLWTARLNTTLFMFSNYSQTFFPQVTIISAALISCERCYAVYWPLKHRTLSLREYRIVIFMSWTLAALFSTIFHLQGFSVTSKEFAFSVLSYFLVYFLIVCGCNTGIWIKFQSVNTALQRQNRAPHNRHLTKTLLFVAIFGLVSFLPLIIVYFLMSFHEVSIHWSVLQTVRLVCFSNAFVNPVVYAIRIPGFREAMRLCCFRRQAAMNRGVHERRDNSAATLATKRNLTSLQIDPSHLQLECKQDVFDTKL